MSERKKKHIRGREKKHWPSFFCVAKPTKLPKPPDRFLVFAEGWGSIREGPRKKPFLFDEKAADMVLASFADIGNELVVDWEHQTLGGPFPGLTVVHLLPDGLRTWSISRAMGCMQRCGGLTKPSN